MKLYVAVLIAAVTVNCLVTAINGEAATDTAAVPYIDMLLPPFEDVPDNSKDAATKNKVEAKPTTVATTTATTKKPTTTTTTKKPITNEVNNNLPELSIEALLPPLFEAKIEQDENKKSTTQKPITTTTTRRPTTTTTKTTTTTAKPLTTTTTVKPSKLEVPDLFLDSLLPPLLDNDIIDANEENVAVTTQKPSLSFKTTKKSYYQQQQTQQLKDQKQQQLKHLQASTNKEVKSYNKPAAADKYVAESKTQTKQVALTTHKQNIKLQSKIENMTKQHVAKQVAQQRQFNNNYSFDLYFGSTTARPAKSGLPTITPFPHRLGR